MAKIHLLSLGCPKNLVDSETLLAKLQAGGLIYTSDPGESDIIMVNTCGFIEDAKRESIEEILKFTEIKRRSHGKKLLVFGCLAKRFGQELKKEIPEIDSLWGVGDEEGIVEYCRSISKSGSEARRLLPGTAVEAGERFSDRPFAYLKIAEGCDRGCSYCVIPGIRGSYRSRMPVDIIRDAEEAVSAGKKELILVAQDISSYGKDIRGYDLSRLVREIAAIKGNFWIRLLYLYPGSISDDLLETISSEPKVCKYIDIPLQHSEGKILKLMRRGGSSVSFRRLLKKIRERIPEVALRTTFIVGFPGETGDDFEGLAAFVEEMKFDRLGVFMYSKEEGTPAAGIRPQVPKRVKQQRYDRIMQIQASISLKKNQALRGRTMTVLVDETDCGIGIGRLYSQAPDIDGVVFVEGDGVEQGRFYEVEIRKIYDYDLSGTARL